LLKHISWQQMIWVLKLFFLLPGLQAKWDLSINFDQGRNDLNCETYDYDSQGASISTLVIGPNMERAYKTCKHELVQNVIQKCSATNIKKFGLINYCGYEYDNEMHCYLTGWECVKSWAQIKETFSDSAIEYIKDKKGWLANEAKLQGFKSCHPIQGLDASVCEKDCQSFLAEDTQLVQKCKAKAGTPKCCIRREKANCHECRYCCTVPFCTWLSNKEYVVGGEMELGIIQYNSSQSSSVQAVDNLLATNHFYKSKDERCLAPDPTKTASQWGHYVPEDFYTAMGKEVKRLKVTEYDNRFFNFEDPDVFSAMTGKAYKKSWEETFGFDYVKKAAWNNQTDNLKCAIDCLKAEKDQFALDCNNNGGLFQCCVTSWNLTDFEITRQRLFTQGLIETKPPEVCFTDKKYQSCIICSATYMCTKMNPFTKKKKITYKTLKANPIGGRTVKTDNAEYNFVRPEGNNFMRAQFRSSFCARLDFCQIDQEYYEINDFFAASNRKDFCSLKSQNIEGKSELHSYKPQLAAACVKESSLVRMCPKKRLKEINDKAYWDQNKRLKLLRRSLNKDKKKRRKKKKKRRQKKQKKRMKKLVNKKKKKSRRKKKQRG